MSNLLKPLNSFNPRSRVGSDNWLYTVLPRKTSFNPRSRVGSDSGSKGREPLCLVFQSTLPCRERLLRSRVKRGEGLFQSTLPCRERQTERALSSLFEGFNPRSRVGSDGWLALRIGLTKRFNPRSRVGSDLSNPDNFTQQIKVSIHAPV